MTAAQPDIAPSLGALRRVMARVAADAGRAGVPAALTSGLVDELGMDAAEVWLYHPADDALHRRARAERAGPPLPDADTIPLDSDDLPLVRAVRARAPVVLVDGSTGAGYAAAPLLVGERLCGAIVVLHSLPVSPPLLEALEALACQAALALDHARLLDESHAFQALATELASTRDPRTLLDRLVERMAGATGADACVVWLVEEAGTRLFPHAACGLSPDFLARVAPYTSAPGAFTNLRRDRSPLHFPNLPAILRGRDPAAAEAYAAEGIISSLRLPLFGADERMLGLLTLYHRRERHYSAEEVRLAQAFADQITVALHNAHLAEQERLAREGAAREVERLDALRHITRELLAATDLKAVLEVVAEAAWRLSAAGGGSIVGLINRERRQLRFEAYRGPMEGFAGGGAWGVTLDETYLTTSATGTAIARGETVVVEDYGTWPPSSFRESTLANGVTALTIAPLRVDGAVTGVLIVNHPTPRRFSADEVAMIEALADQAALAIEHARLLARGQEAAVLEERARLARDLHDSVTQSVFSIGLLTNAALSQSERGLPSVQGTLQRIKAVSQEALSEMRALLYELHPAALVGEGLTKALEKLAAAVQVRVDVPVTFSGETARRLPPETETAIFRIVQEALGNAAKYAHAAAIRVTLTEEPGRLRVAVVDEGRGFDPAAPVTLSADGRRGGMGLRSMRDRAAAAGLELSIHSAPGEGTRVLVTAAFP